MKQWSIPAPTNAKLIMAFDLEARRSETAAPRKVCYTKDLKPVDSEQFERTWQSTENSCDRIFEQINSGKRLNDKSIDVIKDLLALHLIRSFSYWDRHRQRLLKGIDALDLSGRSHDFLTGWYRKRHGGLYPPYFHDRKVVELEWRNYLQQLFDSGPYSADAMLQLFEVMREQIRNYPLTIVDAIKVNTPFIVGDCPVLPLVGPREIADIPFGPTVGAYFFPLGPRYAAFTVRNHQDPHLTEVGVECFNRLQIKNSKKTIVWSPDEDFSDFANSVLNEVDATP